MNESFDYQRFLARRKRFTNAALVLVAAWWTILLVVAIGSDVWAPLARLKAATVWGGLTVDRLLGLGAAVSVAVAIGGRWLLVNLRRPPQLFILLRDFQSSAAAQLARSYVQRYGAAWGYWLTLENADLRAIDSVGGEAETDSDDGNDRNEKPPVGTWWLTSFALGLVLTTMLTLSFLDRAPLKWSRRISTHYGPPGELTFTVVAIVGIGAVLILFTWIIRWMLLNVQRAAFLPDRINSAKTCQSVIDTIVARIRRRATTLTLGPLPVIAVDNAWWQDAVLRCIAEARLVVFMITERESAALVWEMEQVRRLFDPRRTLYIELGGHELRLTDGNGDPIPGGSSGRQVERIEAAVRHILVGQG